MARKAINIWAGWGTGNCCALCKAPIAATEIEYELVTGSPDSASPPQRIHLSCFRSWDASTRRDGWSDLSAV